MLITVFTVKKNGFSKHYSQIEIKEQNLGLLYYSAFFKLVSKRGRPRIIWHESYLQDVLKYCPTIEDDIFRHNWIEKKEFTRIINKQNTFLFNGYGDEVKVPNATTRRAIEELEAGKGHKVGSVAGMMAALDAE